MNANTRKAGKNKDRRAILNAIGELEKARVLARLSTPGGRLPDAVQVAFQTIYDFLHAGSGRE